MQITPITRIGARDQQTQLAVVKGMFVDMSGNRLVKQPFNFFSKIYQKYIILPLLVFSVLILRNLTVNRMSKDLLGISFRH